MPARRLALVIDSVEIAQPAGQRERDCLKIRCCAVFLYIERIVSPKRTLTPWEESVQMRAVVSPRYLLDMRSLMTSSRNALGEKILGSTTRAIPST